MPRRTILSIVVHVGDNIGTRAIGRGDGVAEGSGSREGRAVCPVRRGKRSDEMKKDRR